MSEGHRIDKRLVLLSVLLGGCGSKATPKTEIEFYAGSHSITSARVGTTPVDLASSSNGAYVVEVPRGDQWVVWMAEGRVYRAEVAIGAGEGAITVLRKPPLMRVEGDVRIVKRAR